MKRNLLIAWACVAGCWAQAQSDSFAGTWQGSLDVGIPLRIVFHIRENPAGGFQATADSPDQSAYGLPCDSTIVEQSRIRIVMKNLGAEFTGELVNDTTINGLFSQRAEFPLVLTKNAVIAKRVRPQTPQPPFPYKNEEVHYSNADQTIRFGATLTIPTGQGPFPAVVLISGSGPQDRDETIMDHKLFAVLADYLTRKGIIVLRADERGVGTSTGNFAEATSEDFSNDIGSGIDYLLTRPEVNKKKIGLLGHSEGGMIAPMLAVKRKDIDFIILLAGPGVPIPELMAAQNEAVARSAGVSATALQEIKPLFRSITAAIMQTTDTAAAIKNVTNILELWAANKPVSVLRELNIGTAGERKTYISEMVQQLQSPWFRYFMQFDPQPWLEKLAVKVLALNGDKDIQVVSKQNLDGIRSAMQKSRAKTYEVKELPGLNHLFQACTTCTIQEYGQLEQTVSPEVLEIITAWLEKNVK